MKPITFLALLLLLASGCGKEPTIKGPRDVVFAYADGDGVYVLNGDGSLNKKVIGGYYYQASLSPDKTKVACVYDKDFQVTVFSLDENFESHLKPKTIHNDQALSQGSKMTSVACPVWSNDGGKVYFLNLNHLIAYDYTEQKTSPVFDFPENQWAGQTNETGMMRLSPDGSELYCMLSAGQDQLAFWTVSTGSNQGTPVAIVNRSLLSDLKFPPEMPDDMIENCFGSRNFPVSGPIPSPDRRYFFYFQKGLGFLAPYGIRGYDKTTQQQLMVSDLGTALFSK